MAQLDLQNLGYLDHPLWKKIQLSSELLKPKQVNIANERAWKHSDWVSFGNGISVHTHVFTLTLTHQVSRLGWGEGMKGVLDCGVAGSRRCKASWIQNVALALFYCPLVNCRTTSWVFEKPSVWVRNALWECDVLSFLGLKASYLYNQCQNVISI